MRRREGLVRPAVGEGPPLLPEFDYHLDGSDPDVMVLRRRDGSFVAAFSAMGATSEGILEAAEEDHRALLRERAGPPGLEAPSTTERLRAPSPYSPECV
jgi:hypothetical protein